MNLSSEVTQRVIRGRLLEALEAGQDAAQVDNMVINAHQFQSASDHWKPLKRRM